MQSERLVQQVVNFGYSSFVISAFCLPHQNLKLLISFFCKTDDNIASDNPAAFFLNSGTNTQACYY